MEKEPNDVLNSYESSLEDLTFNSKPIINMLTMTADKYKAQAPEIAELIESRVLKVASLRLLGDSVTVSAKSSLFTQFYALFIFDCSYTCVSVCV